MTEREIEARLRNERISLPDGFEARQEAALRRVMAKREGVLPKRMAWLAAALALMMSAAAMLAAIWDDWPRAMACVTATPAQAAGLTDRGAIRPGLRADLIRFRLHGGTPVLRETWVRGQRVA